MKKIFPYILIVLIIVQLLAPFTVGVGVKNGLEVKSNKAEAADYDYYYMVTTTATDGTKTSVEKRFTFAEYENNNDKAKDACNESRLESLKNDSTNNTITDNQTCIPVKPNTAVSNSSTQFNPVGVSPISNPTKVEENTSELPVCMKGIMPQVGGCIAQAIYYLFFKTTSFVFGLAGKILDFTLMYSISDTSYRSQFVVEGWGLVRDFCNMFFIFILLYIAFGTILNLHSVKTKEMIINVVIIGLLINFSLFATQVIIDASNILTRVFYNQNTIIIGTAQKDAQGNPLPAKNELGEFGEIKLSEAIVSKVDPQKLIINAKAVNEIPKKTLEGEEEETTKSGITTGSFIIIVLLATAVNVVGIIAFLSAGIIFIARVIGLWLAMILAPLAFFSYTVPAMQEWGMIGWKKWWPETLKMAFLAPIFVFFMYLIVGFMDKGLGILNADSKTGLSFVVAIFVPFIFIMILLMKAKDIAKSMSGTMGQSITNGIAAVGGVALGGAALGTAFLGRKIIGGGLATASRSDSAMHLASQKFEHNKKLEQWEKDTKAGKVVGPKPVFIAPKHGDIIGNKNGKDIKFNDINPFTHLGAKLNEKQMRIGDVDHARHEIDDAKKTAGLEGVDDVNLSGVNEKKIKEAFIRNKKSEIESDIRKGYDAKKDITLVDDAGKKVTDSTGNEIKGEEQYKKAKRSEVETQYMAENSISSVKDLTDKDKKNIENQLTADFNVVLKATIKNESENKYAHIREESKQHVGGTERAFSRANTGSYDVRNLSNIKSDQREGLFTKIPVALIAGIATGVRAGIKNTGMSNGSVKIEGDFMKDLGNTISDSLKSMKVNVDLSHVGEHKSSADAHGGGGGH